VSRLGLPKHLGRLDPLSERPQYHHHLSKNFEIKKMSVGFLEIEEDLILFFQLDVLRKQLD
jgi:hypothetical protein